MRFLQNPLLFRRVRGIVSVHSKLPSTPIEFDIASSVLKVKYFSTTPFSNHSSSSSNSSSSSSTTQPPVISKELWTLPNIITISRICASPLLVYAIAHDMKTLALAGCVAGGASDWLDGYISKNYNQMVHLTCVYIYIHYVVTYCTICCLSSITPPFFLFLLLATRACGAASWTL